jgi:probable HAF family extracellular repeat protein
MTDLGVSVTAADRLAINELGQIVGSAVFGSSRHAFSWQSGTPIDLGALPGYVRSAALAVNDVGQVVGFSADSRLLDVRATLWQNGTIIDLDPTGSSSRAIAVNDAGQVLVDGGSGAFIWQNGIRTDLGSLGGGFTQASAMNTVGQVVGVSNGHAFLWHDGAMTDLGLVAGGNFSVAPTVNDLGQVAGTVLEGSIESGFLGRTFLWQNGVRTELMRLDGGTQSQVVGINNGGQVVGWSDGAGQTHAVLWNTLRPATPAEEVSILIGKVNALRNDGTLNHGQCQSLLAKLNAVSAQLAKGNENAAANVLGAFINHVRAFVQSGVLSSEAGQPLIDAAQSAIDGLTS